MKGIYEAWIYPKHTKEGKEKQGKHKQHEERINFSFPSLSGNKCTKSIDEALIYPEHTTVRTHKQTKHTYTQLRENSLSPLSLVTNVRKNNAKLSPRCVCPLTKK